MKAKHSYFCFLTLLLILTSTAPLFALMLDDFESGEIKKRGYETFGWHDYRSDGSPGGAGAYTWEIDHTSGANGSSKSLKLNILNGSPYFYYMSLGENNYIASQLTIPAEQHYNCMRFFMRLPPEWHKNRIDNSRANCNFAIGTYHRDPAVRGRHETNNWHYYYYLKIEPKYINEWIEVNLGTWVQHQRSIGQWSPGCNATVPTGNFFNTLSRIYFTGYPYRTDAGVDYPHSIWFDEFELYYKNEHISTEPEYIAGSAVPGGSVAYPVIVRNAHPAEPREIGLIASTNLFKSSNCYKRRHCIYVDKNNDGHYEIDNTTGILNPGGSKRIFVVVTALEPYGFRYYENAYLHTNLIAYQKWPEVPKNAHIIQNYHNKNEPSANYNIPIDTPAVSTSIITKIVSELPDKDYIAPSAVNDLQVISKDKETVTLQWTNTWDDENEGTAFSFDIRYYKNPITDDNWEEAIPLRGEPKPGRPGTAVQYTTPPLLEPWVKYYFAMKVLDEQSNVSSLSNTVTAVTSPDEEDELDEENEDNEDILTKVILQNGLEGYNGTLTRLLFSKEPDRVFLNVPWANRIGNYAGTNVLWIKFSGIPVSCEIISAKLKLFLKERKYGKVGPITIHSPLHAVAGEGMCWNYYSTGKPWIEPGAGSSDRGPAICETEIGGELNVFIEWDITSIVQEWADNPSTNNGLLMYDHNGVGYSRWGIELDNEQPHRPILEIEYRTLN